jgi:cephalosporin-C deacetylase
VTLVDAAIKPYWDGVDAELAATEPALEFEWSPRLSSPAARVALVRMTAPGPFRLTCYLSVPAGPGPFPALLVTPRYGSVNNPPHPFDQERYVTLVVNHRGQRLSDVPWRASYPGLLVEGIADPARYVIRGVAADCLRALEVLTGRPEVDRSRVGVTGGDLALIAGSRRPDAITAVALTEPLLLYRSLEAAEATTAEPWEEFSDELRARPGSRAAIVQTLRPFDVAALAPDVRAAVLLPTGDAGAIGGPEWYEPLVAALGDRVQTLPLTHFSATDQDAVDLWLSSKLGVPARPRGWQV